MKKWIIASLLLYYSVAGLAQDSAGKYALSITAADLKTQLSVIADSAMEGRETATAGQRKAAAYIEGRFRSLGLKPGNRDSFQQHFPLMEDTILSTTISIGAKQYRFGADYTMTTRWNSTRDIHARKVVFAGYGISDSLYDDYRDIDVRGAIVVVIRGEPRPGNRYILSSGARQSAWSASLRLKIREASKRGALGLFVLDPTIDSEDARSAASGARKSSVYLPRNEPEDSASINVAFVSEELLRDVFGKAKTRSILQVFSKAGSFSRDMYVRSDADVVFNYNEASQQKASSSNVIALVEGSDKKDEFVFITAHYDHLGKKSGMIYYGADDDGSGTVSVLELAEAFALAKADGKGARRTMVFMTVSGEEKGLWGSAFYSEHPIFPLEKTTADLNIDMVGRIDPKRHYGDSLNYIYVIGDNKISSDLKRISDSVNTKYTNLELDPKYNDPQDPERIFYRSDHYNFASKGVPILFYFNGTHADYHRNTDTIDKINFPLMEKRVRFIFYTAWQMANQDDMLKRDIPL